MKHRGDLDPDSGDLLLYKLPGRYRPNNATEVGRGTCPQGYTNKHGQGLYYLRGGLHFLCVRHRGKKRQIKNRKRGRLGGGGMVSVLRIRTGRQPEALVTESQRICTFLRRSEEGWRDMNIQGDLGRGEGAGVEGLCPFQGANLNFLFLLVFTTEGTDAEVGWP